MYNIILYGRSADKHLAQLAEMKRQILELQDKEIVIRFVDMTKLSNEDLSKLMDLVVSSYEDGTMTMEVKDDLIYKLSNANRSI